ncbi:hypothetical protein [Luteimicrobium subarcticum]|uniref:Tetratricopeptide repeat protein n=1 Tax=Luteimicrobium subarcticum TaxID=620910 RepID=A0A2M8WTY1_9MICO|nr:hypothetical protein [Luteimicrobium subarcticum]PJI94395.1 hypothetical protein CLV34_0231 [Luteimicrobium subarcticum]
MRKGLLGAVLLTGVLLLYGFVIGRTVWALVTSGSVVGAVLGGALVVAPLVGVWYIGREWWFAVQVQRLADHLHERGELPVDDLPRSPGGRIDRTVADAQFAERQAEVEADPSDWKRWFNLAFAYDASGDRKRARETLRHAVALEKASRARS